MKKCYPNKLLNSYDSEKLINSYEISKKDKKILRELAKHKAEIAYLNVNQEKTNLWKQLNSLNKTRPLVFITQIPWHELDLNDDLKLKANSLFAQCLETKLRRTIYQWEKMRADMVVEPTITCDCVIYDSGFEISENVDIVKIDERSDVYSRKFIRQIKGFDDIAKIKVPKIFFDKEATENKYQSLIDIFGGILNVKKKGIQEFWFAPWDELVRWWGVQDVLSDLILHPDLVHSAMSRLTDAYLFRLDQYKKLNLLSLNNFNCIIGSGGLGYTDELPQKDFNPNHVKTMDVWGSSAEQIFSAVSPEMHEEFALQYEIRWMQQFGLNYYGCCEPLHKKIDIIKKIPRLRKISMSPWVDLVEGAEKIGKDYVFSWKPNPSVFAGESWDPDFVRKDIANNLNKLKNCIVEIIMKDISTVGYEPQRLWEWAKIAIEESEKLG